MIKKTKIINGLYYIEIPEANLYIQCGAPVESVKHFIKKGFIRDVSKDNITYECGPNAILLSDIAIQNGEFSNMSEFPILQMLYRQGTILPNHPNNTGIKPLLIGLESQIISQKEYIYRGNYGLVSKSEIEKCGISKEYANDLYRLKLKFAFGELKSADKLINTCILENNKVEIRNNAFIQRISVNIFEFSYKDDKVVVDLNLKQNEVYASPYTLPLYDTKREYFSIIHSGQGDGWDINRSSMNSIITFQGRLYLVDVVPNIKFLLNSLSIDINEIEGVFQTHTHDDHIGGITSLIRSDKKIKFYATPLVISATTKKLSALLDINESEFYNLLDIHELKLEEWNNIYGLEVKPILSPHPVETTIFIFRTLFEGGYKTYGHFADIIDLSVLNEMVVESNNDIGVSKKFFDKVTNDYKQKLDLKKLDIGGGMIHGNTEDFKDDKSSRIVLAHNSTTLSKDEKIVGSGSLFGLCDVLIPSTQNYDFTILYDHILSNFPNLEYYQRKMFLNFKIVNFNPETIIIKGVESITNAYLILNGQVEGISSTGDGDKILTPGVIIGEKATFTGLISSYTYIAKNYVKTLEIPVSFFYNFIENNNLLEDMLNKIKKRRFLLASKLFKNDITYPTLDKIIIHTREQSVKKGKINIDKDNIYIIASGTVEVKLKGTVVKVFNEFDDFGLYEHDNTSYTYEASDSCELYIIKYDFLSQIPILRWKILESSKMFTKEIDMDKSV